MGTPTTTTTNGEVGNPATGGGRGKDKEEVKEEGRDEEEDEGQDKEDEGQDEEDEGQDEKENDE